MPLRADELPSGLVNAVEGQSAVLFLGAATSIGAHHPRNETIPNGNQLRDLLSDTFLGGSLKDKALSAVAEYAASETSLRAVQLYISDLLQDFTPADSHLLIPKFRWHGIATTNYDLIVDKAYAPSHSPLQTLVSFVKNGQAVETATKRVIDGLQFLKLHGSIDHCTDTEIPLILATEQYARYSRHRTRLFERFRDWGTEFPIIFCGYSLSDPHIQSILFELFEMVGTRPMYYVVDPALSEIESRYWASRRTTPIRAPFSEFMQALDIAVPPIARTIPRGIGGGISTLRTHYKVANAPETRNLLYFLSEDVDHVRPGMPVEACDPRGFYRGEDSGWGGIEQNLDVPRTITDTLVVDAILANETDRPGVVDFYAVKGPAGNGKTIVLKRAAWVAAHDYGKPVLFLRSAGTIRCDVIAELYQYIQERLFLFVDKAALWVDELEHTLTFARARRIPLTIVVSERDAEWNVRCESLEQFGVREYPVRYLSERAVRALLVKLEQHDSLGLLKELPTFEQRVEKLIGGAQRQLLVALHEATLGKAFEDIVYDEYHRILPNEAQALYLDICTLNRLGVPVRAGLIARISGISFVDFGRRLLRPLEHIVRSYLDKYSGDRVYLARHEHVAEMVFERVLPEPERRFDQVVRIMAGMNLDYSSDRTAFSQLVRGHGIEEAFRSRELGSTFFDAAARVAPDEAFLFQQRGIFEMEGGGSLTLAQEHLERAESLEPRNRSIQHSLAVLARRQALATPNKLLRDRLRDRARARVAPLVGLTAEHSYGYHTAAQIALDELDELLTEEIDDQMTERRIVELIREVENFISEGLQKYPLNSHLLSLEADYLKLMQQHGKAEVALTKAFTANPRQEWIAIRLARTLDSTGRGEEAKTVLVRCLQDNPNSRRVHFQLALLYMGQSSESQRSLILDHLRRSFTAGDRNFEAQFWYAREAFLNGKYDEALRVFRDLADAPIPSSEKTQIRGIIVDKNYRSSVYVSEVVNVEATYIFIKCKEFPDNIFAHRSTVNGEEWDKLRRGSRIACTIGFNLRGPTAATVQLLD